MGRVVNLLKDVVGVLGVMVSGIKDDVSSMGRKAVLVQISIFLLGLGMSGVIMFLAQRFFGLCPPMGCFF